MIQKTGGVLVALRYANALGERGHDVTAYYPLFLSPFHIRHKSPVIKALSFLRYGWRNWRAYRAYLKEGWPAWAKGAFQIRLAWCQSAACLPKADATIATAWTTAYWAVRKQARAGKLFYFIQHYETWDGHEDLVQQSYRLGMHNIVIAPWLQDLVQQYSPSQPLSLIPNGIDANLFTPPALGAPRAGMLSMYHESPIKGMETVAKVFAELHAKDVALPLVMFGVHERPASIAPYVRYVQNPTPAQLVALYQQASFYLSACSSEGWGLTIMEALACGCVVFSPWTGCVPLVNKDEPIVQVFETNKLESMLEQFWFLSQQASEMQALSQKGRAVASSFAWEESEREFVKLVES